MNFLTFQESFLDGPVLDSPVRETKKGTNRAQSYTQSLAEN
jgi:hypothetical protein